MMRASGALRRVAGVLAVLTLGACASQFATTYDAGVDPAVAKHWHLAAVEVTVPTTLKVSEENVLVPEADIVWQEEPAGDRYAQVGAIVKQGVTEGAAGLHGGRPVKILVTVQRFHALTPAAQALEFDNVGVLNVDFTIEVVDARSGKVLAGPEQIQAAEPGLTGEAARAAISQGNTQKVQITAHLKNVVAGWLGIGPDARMTFERVGA